MGPIYILGSERSGTNLLRQRLMEYSNEYHGAPPLHLLKHLYLNAYKYRNTEEITDFMLKLSQSHFAPWDINLAYMAKAAVDNEVEENASVVKIAHLFYLYYAKLNGRKTYICKDNHLFYFASEIERFIPQCHFIYLFRDPRDVVLSESKRPGQCLTYTDLAGRWAEEQRWTLAYLRNTQGKNISPISYECLIKDESGKVKALLNKLGAKTLPQPRQTLETGYSDEWKNLKKTTIKKNYEKWRKELRLKTIARIEAKCISEMIALGYTPENKNLEYYQAENRIFWILKRIELKICSILALRSGSQQWRKDRAIIINKGRAKQIDKNNFGLVFKD